MALAGIPILNSHDLDIGRGANFRIAGHQPTVESSIVLVFDVRPEPDINV